MLAFKMAESFIEHAKLPKIGYAGVERANLICNIRAAMQAGFNDMYAVLSPLDAIIYQC